MRRIRIIVLGQSFCSSACLASQFVYRRPPGDCDPSFSCGDCWKQCIIDGEVCMVSLEDVGSYFIDYPSYFIAQTSGSYQPHGYILLYDVTSRKSFEFTSRAVKMIMRMNRKDTMMSRLPEVDASVCWPYGRTAKIGTQEDRSSKCSWNHERKDTFTCFPRLPAELQLAILRACVTSSRPIVDYKPYLNGINMNVLQVCKLFHKEGKKIFWAENHFMSRQPIYVVADMTWATSTNQEIPSAEGRELADQFGCKFNESSSRSHSNVDTVVTGLIRECVARETQSTGLSSTEQSFQGRHLFFRSLTRSLTQRVSRMFK